MKALLLTALLTVTPAIALAAPPAAIEADARQQIFEAATWGLTPEEAKDPETVSPAMLKTSPKMFRKVDINGDASPDWQVSYMYAPAGNYFCGTGGCTTDLFVALPDGSYRKVFSQQAGDLTFSGPNTARTLETNFHGAICDTYGTEECLRRYAWNDAAGRYVETANSKGLAVLVGGSYPPLFPALADTPVEVRAEVAGRQQACKTAGGAMALDEGLYRDIPDINGDGVRDWLVDGRFEVCSFLEDAPGAAPDSRLTLYVSRPGGGLARAYDREAVIWDLDLGSTPARVLLAAPTDDCGLGGKPCPRSPLTWNPATATFD